MPDTDLVQAGVAVERFCQLLERWNNREHREYRLGLSCGVAAYTPGTAIEEFLRAADSDLYVQKASRENGRNASMGGTVANFQTLAVGPLVPTRLASRRL